VYLFSYAGCSASCFRGVCEIIASGGVSLPSIVNAGPPGCEETTYSFDYGDAHFVVLNEYYNGTSDRGTDGDAADR
jgi:hypothetical protein